MNKAIKSIISIITLLFASGCLFSRIGHTTTEAENMGASVSVNAIFSVVVFPTSLNFGSVDPGATTATRELTLWCSTNNNNPWNLQISDTAELTSGTFTLPNDNFHWWGWSAGSGTWYEGTGLVSTTPFAFYECGLDEYLTTAPVEIHLTFNIDVPAQQPAGAYTTTLVVTMTE